MTRSFRWWHGAAILLAANLIGAFPAGFAGDETFYNSFARPAVAPPDWAFPPVWLLLNITSIVALYKIANTASRPARTWFLASEALGWVLFAAFTMVFFYLRSPTLGAVNTILGLGAALTSFVLALRINKTAAVLIGLRVIWLLLASYVSLWIAVYNVDALFAH